MTCQGIVLATKGIIFKPELIIRYILPLRIRIANNIKQLTLKESNLNKINLRLSNKSLNLVKSNTFKLNTSLSSLLKLNLKKCED